MLEVFAAERLVSMHKRHGNAVTDVLAEKIAEPSEKPAVGTMEPTSLLALVVGRNLGSVRQQLAQGHRRSPERPPGVLEMPSLQPTVR
jgi:hypothetical protein